MTFALMPGVHREEVYPPPARTLRTGVPVFLGRADGAPPGPRPIALPEQLAAHYGGTLDGTPLQRAVTAFFANGGSRCLVTVLPPGPLTPRTAADALDALEALDDVDLVCLPDLIPDQPWTAQPSPDPALRLVIAVQRAVLDHCADRGDRFALLDAVPSLDVGAVHQQRRLLAGPAASFGALYHPWTRIPATSGGTVRLPPSSVVAGVVARSDERTGVHKAPANEVLTGIVDLDDTPDDAEVAALTADGVNCLRRMPGRGIRVWGARTLSDDPQWRYLSTRRVVLTIGRWIERFMLGLVHEPNDVRLRVRVHRELTAYLDQLYRQGVLQGGTPEQAYAVRCDTGTDPAELVDAGVLVAVVAVAPAAPAEFVTVRIVRNPDTVTVTTT